MSRPREDDAAVGGGGSAAGALGCHAVQPTPFNRRLAAVIERLDSLVCIGLDPTGDPDAALDHCRRVIDATAEATVAYKPNSAFFEALGLDGLAILAAVIAHVPDDRLTILDAKRGDIGHTAAAYARAAFQVLGADAVTVSPYLGADSVAPFLADPARGAFVLCHTSNPGASDFQELIVAGRPLYVAIAATVASWSQKDNAGLVVGATFPEAIAAVRAVAPHLPLLVPGIGAQGGDLAATVAAGLDGDGGGMLINSSRAIFQAPDPRIAACRLRDEINGLRRRRAV